MKKDIEWLKEEVWKQDVVMNKGYIYTDDLMSIINEVDEPEVLSDKWIDEHKFNIDTYDEVINVDDLQNLLVPKQEKVKVDKEDAENIKDYKEEGWRLSHLINDTGADANHEELLAQAWLAYPNVEVEKEQKYRVIFPSVDENGKGFNYLAKDCYHKELWIEDTRTDGLAWEERSSFTEDEIRNLDKGDILFEHFAKPVEELGE